MVINLGDFSLTGRDRTKEFIKRLRGKNILVCGNHDKSPMWYIENGFNFACHTFSLRYSNYNIVFSHMPLELLGHHDLNIFVHKHSKGDEFGETHYRLSIENENYSPILLDTILTRYSKYKKSIKKI